MTDFRPILDAMKGKKALVVGDIILDQTVHGEATRLSPEAPCPVLSVPHPEAPEFSLGGAGNVWANLKALGIDADLAGFFGDDYAGNQIIKHDLYHSHGLLWQIEGGTTTLKTRFVDTGKHQLLRCDTDNDGNYPRETQHNWEHRVVKAIRGGIDVLVLSDYGKGVLTGAHFTERFIACARQCQIPIIVDSKRPHPRFAGATLLKVSEKDVGDDLIDEGIEYTLITRGAKGMSLLSDSGTVAQQYDALGGPIADVTGAGDTVTAVMAATATVWSRCLNKASGVEMALVAAAIVVGKPGTATATPEEILVFEANREHPIKVYDPQAEANKLAGRIGGYQIMPGMPTPYSFEAYEATKLVNGWSRKKIGFTNGCFDLLHENHLAILRCAKNDCDKLVVGLNSDASVGNLKGPSRPMQSQDFRARALLGQDCVDAVVIYEEDTPLELIKKIRPDVLIRIREPDGCLPVGSHDVLGWGGDVRVYPRNMAVDDVSTTKIVEAM